MRATAAPSTVLGLVLLLAPRPAAAGETVETRREALVGWSPDAQQYVIHVSRAITGKGARELTLLFDLRKAAPPVPLCDAPRCPSTLREAAPLAARKGCRLVAAATPASGWSARVAMVSGRLQFSLIADGRAGGDGEVVLGHDTAVFSATYRLRGISWAPGRKRVVVHVHRSEMREDGSVVEADSHHPFEVTLPTAR